MRIIKLLFGIIGKIIFIALLAVIVVFCINNNGTITLSLHPLPFEMEISTCLAIILSLALGVFIGVSLSSFSLIKEKFRNLLGGWKIKSLQRRVDKQTEKDRKEKDRKEKDKKIS
jgi:uncharacterized membrane protein YciS (DUF1049 family)